MRRKVELTCGAARTDCRTADPAAALLCSHLNTRSHLFLNTQPRGHTHPQNTQLTAACCVKASSSSGGATSEKYFSVETHFTHRVGSTEVVKDTIKVAMGGIVGWCDMEREMARRGIKGSDSVSKRRWQQEGREGGTRRGGGRDGGGEGWTPGA